MKRTILVAVLTAAGLAVQARAADDVTRIARELNQATASQVPGIIERLAKIGTPKAFEVVIQAAVVYPGAKSAEAARKAIAGADDKVVASLTKLLRSVSQNYIGRQLILQGFALRSDDDSWKAMVDTLKDKVVHVRSAAIQAIADRKDKRGIPILIDFLEEAQKARDRDWLDAREALIRLTGNDFEVIEDWRNFWEANQKTLDPKKVGEESGRTRVRLAKPSDDAPTFFGVEILSYNVLFVIDCSGSMILYDAGGEEDKPQDRMTRAKNQLAKAIEDLRKGSRLNIIRYSDQIVEWQKQMVPLSSSTKKKAQQFALSLRADGWTHTDEALEKAFQIPFVDTIVLLSDGAPTKGTRVPPQATEGPDTLIPKILAKVRELNAIRKIKIFTFGFEKPGSQEPGGAAQPGDEVYAQMFAKFMRDLAEQNGGEYKPIE
ncbi:MAG: VWA domain-containing protein [Planctomycetes bacterium]|nr:VWA domain-containing protein [Planctomycetota bacterium]